MVPVPQHTSRTVLSSSSWAHSPTAEYSTSAAPVFTCFHGLCQQAAETLDEITDIKVTVFVGYLEEGMRRYSELETQELFMNAAVTGHQLARQVLHVRRHPWRSERATQWCICTLVNTALVICSYRWPSLTKYSDVTPLSFPSPSVKCFLMESFSAFTSSSSSF